MEHTNLLRPLRSSLLLPTPLVLDRPLCIGALFHDEGDALGEDDLAPFIPPPPPPPLLLPLAFTSVCRNPFLDWSSFVVIVLVQPFSRFARINANCSGRTVSGGGGILKITEGIVSQYTGCKSREVAVLSAKSRFLSIRLLPVPREGIA